MLDILAGHPSTARFISKELAQRFVADDPPSHTIDRSHGEIVPSTRMATSSRCPAQSLCSTSKGVSSPGRLQSQRIKTPFEMIGSAVRATGAKVDSAMPLSEPTQQSGGASLPETGTDRLFERQRGMGEFSGAAAGSYGEFRCFAAYPEPGARRLKVGIRKKSATALFTWQQHTNLTVHQRNATVQT